MSGLHVPEAARPAWDRLCGALTGYTPPCASQPDLWWSFAPDEIDAAIWGCSRCRVRPPCAAYATTANESHGVWGGRNRETPQSKRKVA